MSNCVFISGWAHGRYPLDTLAATLDHGNAPVWSLAELASNGESRLDYATRFNERIDTMGAPVIVVGWSTGGLVALESAIRKPDNFAGLVLLSATARFCAAPDYPWAIPASKLRAMAMGIRKSPDQTLSDFMMLAAWPRRLDPGQIRHAVGRARDQGENVLRQGLKYLRKADCRTELEMIECPCLIMHGAKDRIVPCEAARWMSGQIKHARYCVWPEAGHNLIQQREDELCRIIKPFLERMSP